MRRFSRSIVPYILALVGPLLICKLKLMTEGIAHYNDIMSATINLGAIGVGFLAAAITLLPSMSNNSFVQTLKQIGAYKKLLKILVHSIILLFVLSIYSVVGVFLGAGPSNPKHIATMPQVLVYIWSYLFVLVIFVCTSVVRLFVKVMFKVADID